MTSTLRAMPKDSELFVVDDGSADDTLSVIERVSANDKRVRVIRNADSKGSGAARNMALRHCQARYFANMDADDVCAPWRFRVQVPRLEWTDLCFAGTVGFRSGLFRYKIPVQSRIMPDEAPIISLLFNPFTHSTMTSRTKVLHEVGGYSEMQNGQDYELWLRLLADGYRLERMRTPVIGYRLSDSQVSASRGYAERVAGARELRRSRLRLAERQLGRPYWDTQSRDAMRGQLRQLSAVNAWQAGRLLRRADRGVYTPPGAVTASP
jgi:glycosyltransferase involved in cell wall biosynthesis